MAFELHPKLAADCERLGDLPLCTVLLMRDERFPWTILVPRIERLRDFHDLPREEALALFDEVDAVSSALIDAFAAEKINVAALGNQVPQLHIHVIARYASDIAWPGPVWNAGPAAGADSQIATERAAALAERLELGSPDISEPL